MAATPVSGPFSPIIRGKRLDRAGTSDSRQTESNEDDALLMEGRVLQDVNGVAARYMGETSEAVFLDHIKDLASASPVAGLPLTPVEASLLTSGSYRTLDSFPLPDASTTDVSPLWLPTPPNMTAMLSALRCILQDATSPDMDSPSSPSGGIYYLSDLTSLPIRKSPTDPADPNLHDYRQLAFFNAAFALTCQVTNAKSPNASDTSISEAFFARAQALTGNPLDMCHVTSIADASTFAMMGLYLAETNRLESARVHITAALRVCEMLGVHLGYTDERGKRIFWTVYVLDRWISLLLGRPVSIPDENIKVELPSDEEMMPAKEGLCAHIELARIAGRMTTTPAKTISEVEGLLWLLNQWNSSLPPNLQLLDGISPDAGVCVLHMHYNHLVVLATRSLLMSASRRLLEERLSNPSTSITLSSHPQVQYIWRCIAAARQTAHLSKHTLSLTRRKLLRPGLSQLYTAALVILVGELVTVEKDQEGEDVTRLSWELGRPDSDTDGEVVDFAAEVFARVASTGDRYGSDCGEVIKGLQNVFRRMKLGGGGDVIAPGVGGGFGVADGNSMFVGDVNMETWMEDTWPSYEGF